MSENIIIVADYAEEASYSLQELSEITGLPQEMILELIAHDIIRAEQEKFNQAQLARLHKAKRLHRDLEINLAGVALAMSLMDELEELRAKLAVLNRHVLK